MLAVYRLGVFVPVPGIDVEALQKMFSTADGTLFGLVNMFSGGSLENFSIFTLGIMPYISVSIIFQFMSPVIPALDALKKEGAAGQKIITRYTRQATLVLALFQGFLIARGLESQPGLVLPPGGMKFYLVTMITLAAGTAFIMWLGEQITEKGIGNGMSMIIFAGIVARMPQQLAETFALSRSGELQPLVVLLIFAFCILTVAAIVFVERTYRKIPVQYPKHNVGKNMQGPPQYLPLKVNMAGVIPPIFASAFFTLPATIASFSTNETVQEVVSYLTPGTWSYTVIFIVYSFFLSTYIAVTYYHYYWFHYNFLNFHLLHQIFLLRYQVNQYECYKILLAKIFLFLNMELKGPCVGHLSFQLKKILFRCYE
jgi:preprotein translocase subunit SecY